jgi:hypothetical protein
MSHETEAASRYRRRAAQLRAIAEAYEDGVTSQTLRGVARDYDLMAMVFDRIDHASIVLLRTRNSN